MAIEGPLQELSIQDVLQLLDLAHKTGVLTIRSESLDDEAIVHFGKGAIVFAVRRRSTRRLGQMLIRAGKLTQRELDSALDQQRRDAGSPRFCWRWAASAKKNWKSSCASRWKRPSTK